jgi:hypothetical protein
MVCPKSRNSVGTNHLFNLFRLPRNYFLSKIPNPNIGLGNRSLIRRMVLKMRSLKPA